MPWPYSDMEDNSCPPLFSIRIWRHLPNYSRKINKERLYKSTRSTQQHQKQQNWEWSVISMKLESFRLSCNTMLRHKTPLKHAHSLIWSSLAEDLAAPSGSYNVLNFHLLWAALWPLGVACLSLHQFSRIYARNALLFAVSHNPMYTTSSTTKFWSFCNSFRWRGEKVCGAHVS